MLTDVQLDPDFATLRAIRKSILRRPVARAPTTIIEEGEGSSSLKPIQSVAEIMDSSEESPEEEDRKWKRWTCSCVAMWNIFFSILEKKLYKNWYHGKFQFFYFWVSDVKGNNYYVFST